jgi:RNA polymerase sigma-70 factor (ECF subfamily)
MHADCFRDAVRCDHDRVLSYAAWMLGDVEPARDIAQEAFLRLWRHHESVAREAARTWLLRTAHRIVLDRRARRGPCYIDLARVLAASEARGPDALAVAGEQTRGVVEALGHLPHRDRALLVLRHQHGLSLAEIGRVLEMPPGTVKVAMHRARRRLCEALPEEERDERHSHSEVFA